ncbi:MAG: hypothetical protein AB7G11_17215 [Phycisphaerales bacterium]
MLRPRETSRRGKYRMTGVLCLGALVAVSAGCNTVRRNRTEIAAPADGWNAPAAVDIENFHGTVTVVVDPTLTEVRPTFKAHASLWIEDAVRKQAIESVKVRTRTLDQEGRAVYSVRTSTTWGDPKQVWIDVTLRMPRCDGVRVFNRGGHVRVWGVGGAIQVDNGEFAGGEGGIEIRTDQDIADPVALITSEGNIVYQVGPGSTGEYTLDAPDGDETFDSNILLPGMIHTNGSITTASVGARDGTPAENAVLLKTARGDTTVIYMNEPMKYRRWEP